jgi:hypothetical protein
MDYKKELLREHSKKQCNRIADNALLTKSNFKKLIDVYFAGPYRITQRAAWPISVCVEREPEIILPYLSRIVKFLDSENVHDAVKRNTLRLLQFVKIPKRLQAKVLDVCFKYLNDANEPVAIHVFAMAVIAQLASEHADIKKELSIVIEDKLPYSSPAFRSRGSKILRQMTK